MSTAQDPLTQRQEGRNPAFLVGGFVILLGLLLVLFGGNLFGGGEQGRDAPLPQTMPRVQLPVRGDPLQVGDRPYEFSLRDLDGNVHQLSEFIGRPLLVNFWATWCGPCRIEMPELQAAFDAYRDEGLIILALDQDESPEAVGDFFDEFQLGFTPLMDEGKDTAERYGTFGSLPTSYFINPEGEITVIHRGPMAREQVENYLSMTIPGQG